MKEFLVDLRNKEDRAGYSASGESSPTPIRSDRGHPYSFKGYTGIQEERSASRGPNRKLYQKKLKFTKEPLPSTTMI